MKFYDANASFGVDMINHECVNHERFVVLERVEIAADAASLIETMDDLGIERAHVWHRSMYELDPSAGNARVSAEIAGHEDRLSASWTVLPAVTDRAYEPGRFFAAMRRSGVKTLHAFPEANRYLLCGVTMGEQLDLIQEKRIPLFLTPKDGYEPIYGVLREFPRLTVVLYNIGWWPSARFLYPLLAGYPNVCFETGDFNMQGGYEEVCARFGSERMLFGTNFPTNSMAGSMYCLIKARIAQDERENIAHRNLERLLREVKL